MREQVCIVLNERESSKARAAESLQQLLQQSGISAARIPVTEHLEKTLKQRQPRVLIIDYLLGDYSTGLDILAAFNAITAERRPVTIFLTDEPSVQVAVDAIKGGAREYLPIEHSLSVGRAARLTQDLLRNAPRAIDAAPAPKLRLRDFVANAKRSRALVEEATAAVQQKAPLLVLLGEPGTGTSTLAHAIHLEQAREAWCEEINLETCTETAQTCMRPLLDAERAYTLILDRVTQCHTDVLDQIEQWSKVAERRGSHPLRSTLVVCTSAPEVARACVRLGKARLIHLPTLSERNDDIPALTQRFTREAEEFARVKLKAPDAATLLWLQDLPWPANLRQVRAVVHDALLIGHASGRPLKDVIEECRARWEEHDQIVTAPHLTPLAAAALLDRCGGNWRVAAALAGCSVAALQSLSSSTPIQ